jgi:nicotinic acetylcholine receptor
LTGIYTLVSLTVFFLVLVDINPPTSFVVPLMGKYLLFTMILIVVSIFITVVVVSGMYC